VAGSRWQIKIENVHTVIFTKHEARNLKHETSTKLKARKLETECVWIFRIYCF